MTYTCAMQIHQNSNTCIGMYILVWKCATKYKFKILVTVANFNLIINKKLFFFLTMASKPKIRFEIS